MVRRLTKYTAPSEEVRERGLARLAPSAAVAKRAEAGVRLWTTAVQAVESFETHIGRYGLSSGRFGVLMALLAAEDHRLPPSELAAHLGVTRPTVTSLVSGLISERLVQRVADADNRRVRPVELTPKGRRAIGRAARDHVRRLAAAHASLSRSDQATLERALPVVARFCKALMEGTSAP
ncbi:MAG: MarR family winged helix-turn-helix transcriptional regulator [Myxococcota bacterium]